MKPSEGQPKERNKGNRRREIKAFRSKGKQQPQQRQQGKGRTRRPGVGAEKGLSSWSGDSRGRTGSLNPALVRPTRGWEQRGPRTARPSFLSPSCPQSTSTVWVFCVPSVEINHQGLILPTSRDRRCSFCTTSRPPLIMKIIFDAAHGMPPHLYRLTNINKSTPRRSPVPCVLPAQSN